MEVGDVLSVQRLGDRQLAWDWVDDEDASRRLVSPGARHTVTQHPVLIPVWADLKHKQTGDEEERAQKDLQLIYYKQEKQKTELNVINNKNNWIKSTPCVKVRAESQTKLPVWPECVSYVSLTLGLHRQHSVHVIKTKATKEAQ